MNEIIKYYITFVLMKKDKGAGFGNLIHSRLTPISTENDIRDISDGIVAENENIDQVIILNWKRIEE